MNTKDLEEGVLKGETFTKKMNYILINILNTHSRVPKLDRQTKESNNYKIYKGREELP
jgi:hypothetical protein